MSTSEFSRPGGRFASFRLVCIGEIAPAWISSEPHVGLRFGLVLMVLLMVLMSLVVVHVQVPFHFHGTPSGVRSASQPPRTCMLEVGCSESLGV